MVNPPQARPTTLRDIALLFLKLGATAFGGPAAHVAMMEQEVVGRRRWLTRDEFLDLLGATNLIPGPNSTEMAIHIGRRQAGWAGLLVAGSCFILPAALIVAALAWVYVRYGSLPEAQDLLYGIKPVIVAIIVQALVRLARTALKGKLLTFLGMLSVALIVMGVDELMVLLAGGVLAAALPFIRRGAGRAAAITSPMLLADAAVGTSAAAVAAAAPFGLAALFLFFLKVGAILFGSGYVLVAFLHADLVQRWHWLTRDQLLDAVAVGQMTPGPVFTTATFVGYVLGGPLAALVATVGIFLPAFVFVAASGPLIPHIRRSPVAGAFLDGVNAASLALMAVVAWHLALSAVRDVATAGLAVLSAVILLRFRVNSSWLIVAGGLLGLLIGLFR